jgi:hypothetical protein
VCRRETNEVIAVERRMCVKHPFEDPYGAGHAVFGPLWRAVWQHRTLTSFGFWLAATLLGGPVWAAPGPSAASPSVVVVTESDALARAVVQVMADVFHVLAVEEDSMCSSSVHTVPVNRLCGTLARQEGLQANFAAKQCNLVMSYQDVCSGTSAAPGALVVLLGSTATKTRWADGVAAAGVVHRRLQPSAVIDATWRMPA